jgi:hypothetical protein
MQRTRMAGVMSVSSAFALLAGAAPATAHQSHGTTAAAGPRVTQRVLLASLVTGQLDELQAKATAARAKVEAVPDDTVLQGRERRAAVGELRSVTGLARALGSIHGLTPAQADRVAAIRTELGVVAGELRALLANRATAHRTDRVKVVRADRAVRAADVRVLADDRRHGDCDKEHDGRADATGVSWRGDGDRRDGRHAQHRRHR